MAEKKKTTEHVVGNVLALVKIWQKKSYNGSTYPLVDGIIFSNTGSKGRTPLFDASLNRTGDIFAYWRDEEKGILEISAPEPGYEIKAPKSMADFFNETFMGKNLTYLDVTHLDVSQSINFSYCFEKFGKGRKSRIRGLEFWDISKGVRFVGMFEDAFPYNSIVNLDLSTWKFSKIREKNMASMFYGFASEAKKVQINGIEKWSVGCYCCNNFNRMFRNFAPHSDWQLDLSNWNKAGKLMGCHEEFSDGTFFKIREPEWKN